MCPKRVFFTEMGPRILAIMTGFGSTVIPGGGAGRPSLLRPRVGASGWGKERGGPARRKGVKGKEAGPAQR